MLSDSEIKNIKNQIIAHIDSTFPKEQREAAKLRVMSMSSSELEKFIEQNNLLGDSIEETKCIFCSISSGNMDSVKIDENKGAVAVFEINPISRGHVLIIPKEHLSDKNKISKSVVKLSNKISKKLQKKLKPREILVSNVNLFGHEVINLIPVYKDEKLNSPRKKADKKDLEEIKKDLEEIKKSAVKKTKSTEIKEKIWLPRRIP